MPPQAPESTMPSEPPAGLADSISDVRVVNDTTGGDDGRKDNLCRSITNKINGTLEGFFASVGFVVASNPWKTIIITLIISSLCLIGVSQLEEENRGEKLWVSQSADPIKHKEWVDDVFPVNSRPVGLLLEKSNGGDLLTREGLLKLYEVDQMTRAMLNGTAERQWKDICFSPGNGQCIPSSILELWSYDLPTISNLTESEIKSVVNTIGLVSPVTGRNVTIQRIIGGPVQRDTNGLIIGASVLKIEYRLKKRDIFVESKGKNVDEHADAWEEEFERTFDRTFPGYTVYSHSETSQQKASEDASNGDLQFFVVGYILVIIYLSTMLGSFSRVGHKFFLAIAGIGVIGISIGISFGLGSAFQLKYTGVHNVLPFLLLGIGVDDIFVIVQNWENIGGGKADHRSIPEKVSLAMRHAGVSVLVTSVTDICAFIVGSTTILPALRSFSIWCAIGILSIFLLTITLFVALLTLDAKRQEKRRDALLCCLKVSDSWQPMKWTEKKYLKGFLKNYYAKFILSTPGKTFVLLAVAGLLSVGGYGLTELEQNFDFIWFLPTDSRPRMYVEKDRVAFPGEGDAGNVYLGQIDYFKSLDQMDKIKAALDNDAYIAKGSVNSWYHHYQSWIYQNHHGELVPDQCLPVVCLPKNETRFYELLRVFLSTRDGQNYQKRILFNGNGKIRASTIGYRHTKLVGSVQEVDAMDSITETIKPGFIRDGGEEILPFAYSPKYINWETNKVISKELVQNIGLATACVFVVTLFLLSNLWASLMVVACVAFSLIEIAAFMGFWGLTIDTVTTIILVIAIGLTVDYSVHIAHGFMASRGTDKNVRMTTALSEVGPAVIHGGMSTFFAFALLAASESYAFTTFFKVFFLVVCFGIFHGMVFLPVILSLIGPAPYADHQDNKDGVTNSNSDAAGNDVVDTIGKILAKDEMNGTSGGDVHLKKMTKRNQEDEFVVVVENNGGGEKNIAYVPDE